MPHFGEKVIPNSESHPSFFRLKLTNFDFSESNLSEPLCVCIQQEFNVCLCFFSYRTHYMFASSTARFPKKKLNSLIEDLRKGCEYAFYSLSINYEASFPCRLISDNSIFFIKIEIRQRPTPQASLMLLKIKAFSTPIILFASDKTFLNAPGKNVFSSRVRVTYVGSNSNLRT